MGTPPARRCRESVARWQTPSALLLLAAALPLCACSPSLEGDENALVQTEAHVRRRGPSDLDPIVISPKHHSLGYYTRHSVNLTAPNAANLTGVTANAEGDLSTFGVSLVMYGFGACFLVGVFMFFRRHFPMMYNNNVTIGVAPSTPENTYFGWARAALGTTTEEAMDSIGLDNAMLLEFTGLCMRILATFGLPMFFIMGPLNWICGGHNAGNDRLSYLSFGNVENGSWLYWIHCFLVWGVVATVQINIHKSMQKFLRLRYRWLRELPEPRSTTVLVEGIPEEYRSDEKLQEFFKKMFSESDVVKTAYVVKDTKSLPQLLRQREKEEKSMVYYPSSAPEHQSAKTRLDDVGQQILKLRDEIRLSASTMVGGVNLGSGFVTFCERKHAELAKMVKYGSDADEWNVSTPPAPSSVLWGDLMQDDSVKTVETLIGYGLVAGLYIAYLPLVLLITNIAKKIKLGPLQPLWASLAPTMGLQVMVAFLPTFLILIFRFFFTLKDNRWAQQRLQNWYFVFQVVFVLLVTAIGQDILDTSKKIIEDPFSIFRILAEEMPVATHFYMNFLVLQWFTHTMNLTRYFPLFKYLTARRFYEEEDARQLAEPEDQDYYGTGSRSARFTINMLIGIIFGTLSPPIPILALINFAVCRLVYGYLFCFAETKKSDLGGTFWVHQLKHLYVGNVIYVILMSGVLYYRAASSVPAFIAAASLLYVAGSYYRFLQGFSWEELPYIEIVQYEPRKDPNGAEYVQPDLALNQ